MSRFIRDYIEVGDRVSLDAFIARLAAIRDALPEGADAQVLMRGDENFGHHLAVRFNRPLTAVEAECEARHAEAALKLAA